MEESHLLQSDQTLDTNYSVSPLSHLVMVNKDPNIPAISLKHLP